MPFIEVKTNQSIDNEAKVKIKSALGEAITAIPGKSESWLMVKIDDSADMWFKGSDEPCAMFDVSVFGNASAQSYEKLTSLLCGIAQDYMGISPDRVYAKYTGIENWGYNNFNF